MQNISTFTRSNSSHWRHLIYFQIVPPSLIHFSAQTQLSCQLLSVITDYFFLQLLLSSHLAQQFSLVSSFLSTAAVTAYFLQQINFSVFIESNQSDELVFMLCDQLLCVLQVQVPWSRCVPLYFDWTDVWYGSGGGAAVQDCPVGWEPPTTSCQDGCRAAVQYPESWWYCESAAPATLWNRGW